MEMNSCKILMSICLALLFCHSHTFKYDTKYILQKVDHFEYANADYFKQRYLINQDFYSNCSGTILFYTGNEGDIEMFANNTGFMWENAEFLGAAIVFAEHRYYGQSLPYGNLSYVDNQHLGYLTSEQALADFASLISFLKTDLPCACRVPVIAIGGSYGGMLAAWIRMKYPHLVDGAIASSAPVLQFKDITPCETFSKIVTKDFKDQGVECAKSIQRSWDTIDRFFKKRSGRKFLLKKFRICQDLQHFKLDEFKNWLEETWNNLAMTNYPYPSSFLVPLPANPIKEACKLLDNSSVSDVKLLCNIHNAVSVFQNYTGDVRCFNLSKAGGSSLGEDGWDYQSCTEMVMPMCQTGTTDMFQPQEWNFTSFSQSCKMKYGVVPEQYKAVMLYGGKNINASSNIIFTNGLLDPWSGGGILESVSDTVLAVLIKDAAHHLDLRSSNPADPPSVLKARNILLKWVIKWRSEKVYIEK